MTPPEPSCPAGRTRVLRSSSRQLVIAAAALALAGIPTLTAAAALNRTGSSTATDTGRRVTFGVQPVTAGKLDSRPYLTYGATAGAALTDHVAVVNYSARPLTLEVYATDAINDDKGDLTLLGPAQQPRDAGAWIALGTRGASGRVRIKARSMAILPLHLRVPAGATPGDHVAGVVASLSTLTKRRGVNVRLHQRVGTRVFIRVAGPLHPGLTVERLSARYRNNWNPLGGGGATVTYRVHNTGNVQLGGRQLVTVHGLFGETEQVRPPVIPLLLPGSSVDVRVAVHGVMPDVRKGASVAISPLVVQGDDDPGLHEYAASTHFWAIPWVLFAILLGVLLALWFWWRERRRRARPGRHRSVAGQPSGRLEQPPAGVVG